MFLFFKPLTPYINRKSSRYHEKKVQYLKPQSLKQKMVFHAVKIVYAKVAEGIPMEKSIS